MEEALIKRILPHSMEAEQSVIGSMIMSRDAIVEASEMITGADFYQQQYGIVFEAMVELHDEGKAVDLVTLQERLKEKDLPPEISSMEFVRDLLAAVPTSANVKYYAEIVAEKSMLRKLIKTTEEISNACYLGKEKTQDILEVTEKKIFDLVQNRGSEEFVPIRQVVLNAIEKIEKASRTQGSVTGISTGFIDLDYKMSGFQPSDLILVAARPSMGKTAFVLNIAQYMAFHSDVTTAIFSLEMSKEQLVNRLLALESKVDSQNIRTGNLEDEEWAKLIEGANIIGKSNLIIDDKPGISISELRSKCRKYKMEHNLGIIFIDYLQLMTGSGRSESRQQEISEISRSLKALARELHVPVVALSQLSRAVEQRPDHRPMLSDLRESGAIEQDADVVMFIYRDDYYNKDSENKNIAEIIIAKQRIIVVISKSGLDAELYEICEYEKKRQPLSCGCLLEYPVSLVIDADNFPFQNPVHIFYSTEVSAHTAGIFFFRFGLCPVASGFFRVHTEPEHFFPVQPFSSRAHGIIPVRSPMDSFGNVRSMGRYFRSDNPFFYVLFVRQTQMFCGSDIAQERRTVGSCYSAAYGSCNVVISRCNVCHQRTQYIKRCTLTYGLLDFHIGFNLI